MMRIVCLVLGFLAGSLLLPGNAQSQILIEQGKINLSVSPGDNRSDAVAIHNTSDKPIDVKAYWEDFDYVEPFDGKKIFSPVGTSQHSLGKWIQFSPQEFTLEPFSSKKITYTVNIPADAKGGYNGVLFVEKFDKSSLDKTGVRLVTRVGCLFFVEMKGTPKTVQIENIAAKKDASKVCSRIPVRSSCFPKAFTMS